MPARSESRRRRRKIFYIALAALIFAETGYILGTTGLGGIILGGKGAGTPSFDVVLNTERSYVFYKGNVTEGPPPNFSNAYVYVFNYMPGVPLQDALATKLLIDSAERPVYVVPVPLQGTGVLEDDFYSLRNAQGHPIVVLTYSQAQWQKVAAWINAVLNKYNVGLGQTGAVRITITNGVAQAAISV
ncbi:MAG: hypothetical protein ABWK05_00515 [Pyrobaculum sp.]